MTRRDTAADTQYAPFCNMHHFGLVQKFAHTRTTLTKGRILCCLFPQCWLRLPQHALGQCCCCIRRQNCANLLFHSPWGTYMKSVAFECSSDEYENGDMYKTRGFQRPYLPPPSLCVQFPHSTGWHDQKFWGGFLAAGRAGPQTLVTFLISIESPMWLHIQWWRHELDLQRGTNHDLSPCPNFG